VQRNRNGHGGVVDVDESWAFGQTLSVAMIFANMNEVIHFFFGFIARRRQRSGERQAEAQQPSNDTDVPPASTPYQPRGLPGSHLFSKAHCTARCEWDAELHVAARDSSQMRLSSEHELLRVNRENSHLSETTVGENSQIRDQPIGTLR